MKKVIIVAMLSVGASAAYADTSYPLTVENCGQSVTFERAPSGAVAVGQATTEVLYALGLKEDKVLGTGVWFNEVLPEFAV